MRVQPQAVPSREGMLAMLMLETARVFDDAQLDELIERSIEMARRGRRMVRRGGRKTFPKPRRKKY